MKNIDADIAATFARIVSIPREHREDALWIAEGWLRYFLSSKATKLFSTYFRENLAIDVAECRDRGRKVKPYMLALYKAFQIKNAEAQQLLTLRDAAICGTD